MSDNIDNITFNILWDDIMQNDMEDNSLKTTNKTANGKIEENGTIESQSADETVQELSFEDFIKLYGFDARVLDDTFENITSNEVASIPIPELNEEFEDIDMCTVKKRILEQENKATMKKTKTDVEKFKRFLKLKGESRELHVLDVDSLDEYVANFILSCKTKSGTDYEPSSIRNIMSSIDRELKHNKYPYLIMSNTGPEFSLSRDAFAARSKSLKRQGKGNKPKAASPLTDDEIEALYQKQILGCQTPCALLNTMWYNNCVHFGLRGTTEQYNLWFE